MSIVNSETIRAISKCQCHAQILVPELLTMIFHDVMALHERRPILLLPITSKHPQNEIDTRPLLTLSHVCRYWRDVAIGAPALWTRVHWRNQDQMDAFLERSSPLAVTVFLDREHVGDNWNGPFPDRMESAVRALAPRLRRLDLAMPPTWQHVVSLLAWPQAPQLECRTIMSPDAGRHLRNTLCWTPLLNCEASSLRALGLLSVVDWLPSSAFPNLTHLVLYFEPDVEELRHPFNLLRLLCNTPALEFLHVDFPLYEGPYMGSWQPPPTPIPLPRLRSLVFTDCDYIVPYAVLPRISLPEDVFIRLQEIINFLPEDGPAAPLPPLPIHPVTHLDIAMHGEELLMIADGPSSGLWFKGEHVLDDFSDPQGWSAWLLDLPECLPLAHVTHLHIYVQGCETFWPALLARLPQVTHLAVLLCESNLNGVRESPTTTLCDALSPREAGPVLCPALDTLAVEWPSEITRKDFLSFPRFLDMLKARSRAGHPIRRIVVQAPADPSSGDEIRVEGLSFIELHMLASIWGHPRGTEYEVVERLNVYEKGLCAFHMREV